MILDIVLSIGFALLVVLTPLLFIMLHR